MDLESEIPWKPTSSSAPMARRDTDEVKPDWDLSGAEDDTRVLFKVGYAVAQTDAMPAWKPGTEFKAKRDSMMGGRTDAQKGVELKKP